MTMTSLGKNSIGCTVTKRQRKNAARAVCLPMELCVTDVPFVRGGGIADCKMDLNDRVSMSVCLHHVENVLKDLVTNVQGLIHLRTITAQVFSVSVPGDVVSGTVTGVLGGIIVPSCRMKT